MGGGCLNFFLLKGVVKGGLFSCIPWVTFLVPLFILIEVFFYQNKIKFLHSIATN